jgi:hypothetical protein
MQFCTVTERLFNETEWSCLNLRTGLCKQGVFSPERVNAICRPLIARTFASLRTSVEFSFLSDVKLSSCLTTSVGNGAFFRHLSGKKRERLKSLPRVSDEYIILRVSRLTSPVFRFLLPNLFGRIISSCIMSHTSMEPSRPYIIVQAFMTVQDWSRGRRMKQDLI